VFSVFLGRTARQDELAGMRPLVRMFESRVFCDGAIWSDAYDDAIADGMLGVAATDYANEVCVSGGSEEYGIDFCGCLQGEGSVGCRSTTLGSTIDIGSAGCRNPESETGLENLFRVNDTMVTGQRTSCPTAGGASRACEDRIVDEAEKVAGPLRSLGLLDEGQRKRIGAVGEALAAREDFWEAGADREIGRLIGWWKDGVRRPDFDLPEVRTLLANSRHRLHERPLARPRRYLTVKLWWRPRGWWSADRPNDRADDEPDSPRSLVRARSRQRRRHPTAKTGFGALTLIGSPRRCAEAGYELRVVLFRLGDGPCGWQLGSGRPQSQRASSRATGS
jgi:hypothetical protein